MKITQVEYRETVSFGNFQNLSVGYTAAVGEHESPAAVLRTLAEMAGRDAKEAADRRERDREEQWRRESEADRVTRRLDELNALVEDAGLRWERAKAFLESHGIDTSQYDVPF